MSPSRNDKLLERLCATSALASGGLVLLIFVFLAIHSWPAITSIGVGRMFSDASWHPTANQPTFGVLPMLAGSCLVTAGAIAWAVPAGLAMAIVIRFFAIPIMAALLVRVAELLAGIPSVVYGFWGLVCLVPLISQWRPPGQCVLAGIMVLGLMIVPTVALTSLAALKAVPAQYRQAAEALGLSSFRYIVSLAIPSAARGILSGVVLALARAIGETMAVLMVCGNIVQIPESLFDPVRTVTANIAMEMGDDTMFHRAVLFFTGLILMAMVAALLVMAEPLRRKRVAHG